MNMMAMTMRNVFNSDIASAVFPFLHSMIKDIIPSMMRMMIKAGMDRTMRSVCS
jgi:hypothetical protein